MNSSRIAFVLLSFALIVTSPYQVQGQNRPAPQPALPGPLPQLPPPLAEQTLPFPQRAIDRPYTLPKGLSEFQLRGSIAYSEASGSELFFLDYLVDARYRQPLTNDFTLLWNPLPLGVQYQPKRTETAVTGVSWNLGWQYQGNLGVRPQFESYLRSTINRRAALEMELTYFSFIPFDKASSIWSSQFRLGPVFQRSDSFAISPRIAISIDNVRVRNIFQPKRTPIEDADVTSDSARVTVPLSIWAQWSPNSFWDASVEYTLLGSGFRTGAYTQLLTLGASARW